MTYHVTMEKDLCLVCGNPATQYFSTNTNLPLCGRQACELTLIDQINVEFDVLSNEARAEAASE